MPKTLFNDPSPHETMVLSQRFGLENSEYLDTYLAHDGFKAFLKAREMTPEQIVEELYLAALSRPPDQDERATAKEAITRSPNAKAGLEDLFWALLNSKEFLYKH